MMNNITYKQHFKRVFDFFISSFLIFLLSPIIGIIFLLLTTLTRENPLFFQLRPGKDIKIFNLIKFKTMNDKRDNNGNFLSDAERLTIIGKFIRKTSLDELPQLINVLKGDMSLIGPRPLLVQYLPLYNHEQKRRHEVKPGITGWAQVNGRNAISWEQRFEFDVWYVDNMSFWLDMKILYLTILKVVKSEGISQHGEATMEAFKGQKQ
jgi:undecaprenyl phosphate N,N'-diacetylbacillosamine 1-phosphate transferase